MKAETIKARFPTLPWRLINHAAEHGFPKCLTCKAEVTNIGNGGQFARYCSYGCRPNKRVRVATTIPTLPSYLKVVSTNGSKLTIKCTRCGESRCRFHKAKTYDCKCSRKVEVRRLSTKEFLRRVKASGTNLKVVGAYKGAAHPIDVQCPDCLKRYSVEAGNLANGQRCSCTKGKRVGAALKKSWRNPTIRAKRLAKFTETMRSRHGVDYPMQMDGAFHSAVKRKRTKIAGRQFMYQGYENLAIQYLVDNGVKVGSITVGSGVPSVRYCYKKSRCVYHPDLYVAHQNRIIEVKSTYTASIDRRRIKAKGLACLKAGYKYSLLVIEPKLGVLHAHSINSYPKRWERHTRKEGGAQGSRRN